MIAFILVAVLAAIISLVGDWCRARGYQYRARLCNAAIVGVYVGAFCGLVLGVLVAVFDYSFIPKAPAGWGRMGWNWALELGAANGAMLGAAIALLVVHLLFRRSDAC
jgi:hypothetical protein